MARLMRALIEALPPDERGANEARAREILQEELSLQEIRKAMGKTQVRMARDLNVGQAVISRLESQADMMLSTLRSYVRSLGGSLELVAQFEGKSVRISGFGDIGPSAEGAAAPARKKRAGGPISSKPVRTRAHKAASRKMEPRR